MTRYLVYDKDAEVTGGSILATMAGLQALGIDPRPYLEKYELEGIKAEDWYSMQRWFDILADIQDTESNFTSLMTIAAKGMDFGVVPPGIDSLEKALLAWNDIYHFSHRNGYIGEVNVKQMKPRHFRITSHNPYPPDFELGMLWGIARKLVPPESNLKVVHAEKPCRAKSGQTCIFDVTW